MESWTLSDMVGRLRVAFCNVFTGHAELSACLSVIKHHFIKLFEPVDPNPHAGLTSAVADGQCLGSSYSRFNPQTGPVFCICWEVLAEPQQV
jgi:hypothetical protein